MMKCYNAIVLLGVSSQKRSLSKTIELGDYGCYDIV